MAAPRYLRSLDIVLILLAMCVVDHCQCLDEYPGHHRSKRNANRATEQADWFEVGQAELRETIARGFNAGVAKNVILFLGDGMGPSTVTSARIYQGQTRGITYKDSWLAWDRFPNTAISRNYLVDQHVADSAGSANAYLTGEKTRSGVIGTGQATIRGDCESSVGQDTKSILAHSQDEGKWTGVVTTTRITHATPSNAYAHSADRNWESDSDIPVAERGLGCDDIAKQLIDNEYAKDIRVLLGGGRKSFYPAGMADPEETGKTGNRLDNRNLVEDWVNDKVQRGFKSEDVHYVMRQSEFDAVDPNEAEFLLGLFSNSHMAYETDRQDPQQEKWGEPSLMEMTEKAIRMLSRSEKGYFLLVEGGRIDHGHHDNYAMRALNETVMLSDAVQKALDIVDLDDTLVVTTADHSHSFVFSGYGDIDTDVLGLEGAMESTDGLDYTSVAYMNGPAWAYHREGQATRRDPTLDLAKLGTDPTFRYDAAIPRPEGDETHGGEDVFIYATGPMSHLFKGVHQQNFIAHAMMYASCVGPNHELCDNGAQFPGCPANDAMFNGINVVLVVCLLAMMALLQY